MERKIKSILIVGIVLISVIVFSFLLLNFLSVENINQNEEAIRSFISQNYFLATLIILILALIAFNSPLPLGTLFLFLIGFFFGFTAGLIINIFVTLFACYIGYLYSRYLFYDSLNHKFIKTIKKIRTKIENGAFNYFLSIRVMQVIPYFLINIAGGVTKIKHSTFLMTTLIGEIPGAILYTYLGSETQKLTSYSQIFDPSFIAIFIALGIIALVPVLIRHRKKH